MYQLVPPRIAGNRRIMEHRDAYRRNRNCGSGVRFPGDTYPVFILGEIQTTMILTHDEFIENIMSPRLFFAVLLLLLCCGTLAGCLESNFKNAAYAQDTLTIQARNAGSATPAVLQVTIFQVKNLQQTEIFTKVDDVTFASGDNTYTVPVHLETGTYKLYIYITVGNDRRVSVIRDLSV